jgi:hypothetical protein
MGAGKVCKDATECLSGKCEKAADDATETSCIGDATTPPAGGGGSSEPSSFPLPNFLAAGGGSTDDPSYIIGRVIKYIIGFSGTIALLTFMYGGALWLISAGRMDYVTKGRNYMIWAAIGLAIVFGSQIILSQILSFLS